MVFLQKFMRKEVSLLISILLVVFLSFVNFGVIGPDGHWAIQDLLTGDGATYVLMATSHSKGMGSIYKDYWEYRPPGFFMLIDFWASFIGSRALSFKFLEALIRFLVGLQICFLARKVFSRFQALVVSFLTIIVILSPAFGAWLYPEAYGIFFSLMGLLSLVYIRRLGLRFFLAAFFLSLSMQMKDIFGGAFLAIIPPLFYPLVRWDYKSFFKGIIFALSGWLFSLGILLVYLVSLNSLKAYFEVLSFKSSIYAGSFWTRLGFFWYQYLRFFWLSKKFITFFYDYTLMILTVWLVSALFLFFKNKISMMLSVKDNTLVLKIPSFRFSINSRALNVVTVLFYSAGSFFGPSLMSVCSPHYVFSVIVPTYFFWSIIAFFIAESLRSLSKIIKKNLVFLFAVLFFLLPQDWAQEPYSTTIPRNILKEAHKNITREDNTLSVERYINEKTNSGDCILSIYGWKSSETYLYSERKPCTRFFIPNMANADWQKKEYLTAIIENPPKAVVYSPAGADMDFLLFEQEVFNFPRVLENCYQQDLTYTYDRWPLKLYFPIYSNENLKNCIKENAR